ncbi:MAG: DoxX family protein [Planctomycetia bacterium]|nr:DoxX family protein [Planctomycetia bacterium]
MLLRITIGWHILYEGIWKYQQQDFSADGYLSQASGPFADYFHNKVMKDFEGRKRLSEQWNTDEMDRYQDRFAVQMKLEGDAKSLADRALAARKDNVKSFLNDPSNKKLFADYFQEWDKLNQKKAEVDARDGGVVFERKRLWEAEQKLRADGRPWLKWIDDQHDGLHADLQRTLPLDDREKQMVPTIKEVFTDTDKFVTYANIAIGACLIVGLFSRLAALGGGIFLAAIVAAKWQWPGYYAPDPHPAQGHTMFVTKEFVEMMACFALATLPTGRWGGFDYFVHNLCVRPFLRNKDERRT